MNALFTRGNRRRTTPIIIPPEMGILIAGAEPLMETNRPIGTKTGPSRRMVNQDGPSSDRIWERSVPQISHPAFGLRYDLNSFPSPQAGQRPQIPRQIAIRTVGRTVVRMGAVMILAFFELLRIAPADCSSISPALLSGTKYPDYPAPEADPLEVDRPHHQVW